MHETDDDVRGGSQTVPPSGIAPFVEAAFGPEIDYAMLIKLFGRKVESAETRYSPAECIGTRPT